MTNKLRLAIEIAVLAIMGFVGFRIWLGEHDRYKEAMALAGQRDKQLDSTNALLAIERTARVKLEAKHAADRAKIDSTNARLAAKDTALAAVGIRLDSALAKRFEVAGDTAGERMLAEFQKNCEGRLAGKDSVIHGDSVSRRDALADLDAEKAAGAKLQKLADDWKAQAERYKHLAQPGFFKRVVAGLPWFAGGGAAVAILRTVFAG